MKLIINFTRDDDFQYVTIEGLKKSRVNEQKATELVCDVLKEKMLTRFTLNNWKRDVLRISYATNLTELSKLFDAIKADVKLPETHDERSLLY